MPWTPTAEQRAVISHDMSRNGRVLAGPGTGKSTTVIEMLRQNTGGGGGPGKLLTFTRSATAELNEKLAPHPVGVERPSTVHSFAITTLLANPGTSGLPEPIRIADDWEWKKLIREHLKMLVNCGVRDIDRARTELASNWQSLAPIDEPQLPEDIRNRFAGIWESHRVVLGYSLLAELPFRLLRALQDHPNLEIGDWTVLVVDEYQDLNLCDVSVLKQISDRGRCLVAVGDDDQSIYSFRLAHPAGIRDFVTEYYPGAEDYTLSISQRCATSILGWARHIIEGLPGRPSRPPLTPAPHCQPGEARYLRFDTSKQETSGVARLVRWLMDSKGIDPEDIAVLFRSNPNSAWSAPLIKQLEAREVPVINPSEVADMLEEDSNRRLLATARLLVNQYDSLAWWTILELTRGIGPTVRDHFYCRARALSSSFADRLVAEYEDGYPDLPAALRNRLINTIRPILELTNSVDIYAVDLGAGGWGEWLRQHSVGLGGCEDRFCDLLTDLDDTIDRSEGLGRFLSQIQPVGHDLRSGRAAKAVRLMSMTSSKGLTLRAAVIVGVEEGVIPLEGRDRDEERRLLYVAMTRSTEFLYLTWSGQRIGPTARTGAPKVGGSRNRSPLLTHGPVQSESGIGYLTSRGA